MDRSSALLLSLAAGGLIALQGPINAQLGRAVGAPQAASVSLLVALATVLVVALFAPGGLTQLTNLRGVPWYYLIGGVLGAGYVTTVLITVRSLGASTVVAATIAGQLCVALIVDHAGALGLAERPITTARVAAVVVLGVGVWLFIRT